MTMEFGLRTNDLTARSIIDRLRVHGLTPGTGGAICGLCGGIGAAVLGSIITAVAWFTGPEWHGHLLQRDGTVLLFLTIPLLIFGAHCLDLIDTEVKVWTTGRKNEDRENG